jgi:vitamin B12 transporter
MQSKKNLRLSMLMSLVLTGGTLLPCVANAEEETPAYNLDEVVVTATRTPVQVFDSHANVNVVSKKELETKHYQTVSEALRTVPGVTIKNYSASGANYSSNNIYINGSAHVVVLVDGMRVNTNGSTFSSFETSELSNMDTIDHIEVLKGSASTLYGSDAVGGVVNIITKKPEAGKVNTKISASWGSAAKQTYTFYNNGMTKNGFYWAVGAQKDKMGDYTDGDGNQTINKIDSETYDVKLGQKFGDKADIVFNYQKYKLDYERPQTAGMGGSFTGLADEGTKDNTKYSTQFKYKFNDRLTNDFSYYSRTADLDDDTNHPATLWLMRQKTWGISDQLTYNTKHHTLIGGYDYYKDEMNKYQDQYTPSLTGNITNSAFFLQDQMKFGPWSITPGIRQTHNSEYGNNTSKSGVVAYDFNDRTTAYVSYKEFFRAPALYELYNPFYGSEALNPEKGSTKEIGLNTRIDDKTTFAAHIFQTDSDNLIGFNSATWKYYNTGDETIKGWDIQLTKFFDKNWSLNAAYTHIAIDATSTSTNENRNGSIPKGQFDIGLNYNNAKFTGTFTAKGTIDRPGSKYYENAVDDSYKTFWIFDAGINYKPVKNTTLFLKVNNLFDTMYTDMTYDMRNPGGSSWYSQPGRFFQAGVAFTF